MKVCHTPKVAIKTDDIDRHLRTLFVCGKGAFFKSKACENDVANVLRYQPKMPRELQDEEGKFHNRYIIYIQRAWRPS